MKTRKLVLYVLLSVFCLAAIALPAAPAQASGAYITLTPSSGPPGQAVQVEGYGFVPAETGIHVLFDGEQVAGGCQADAYGDWALSFQVPLKPPGVYSVTAQGTNTTPVADTFEIKPLLTITSTAGGSVTTPGEGSFVYGYGTVVNLVATPASGYRFVNWSGDVGTIANVNAASTTITMNGHYSITANFEQIPVTYYTLTMSVNGSGSTSPSVGQHNYVAGTVVPISATPTSGHRFVNWTGDVGTIADVFAANTTITMNGHYSITANFDYTLALGCLVSPNPTEVGHVTNFTAAASGGVGNYTWLWTVNGAAVATTQHTSYTFASAGYYSVCVNVTDSLGNKDQCCTNVTVNPAPSGVYYLTVSSTAGGSVPIPGEGTFNYTAGTVVNLVASQDVGYYFVNWTGDVDTIAYVNSANTTITMQGDYEITARFVGVGAAKTETVTGGGTVDATEEADTEVAVNGTATVTVAQYEENPGGPPPTGFNSLDKYIDVYVPDTTEANELEIRLYYTDAELAAANISEESLRLFWWDGEDWVACSDSGVNTASTNGYSGYIWAKIRNDTTPSLDQLQGTAWGGYAHPSEVPQPLCFIATAAYGTDTAKEIDILREFRDAVLLPNSLGAEFVSLYYKTSPPIANFISQHEVLRTAVRVGFVNPIVKILIWSHALWSARGS